MNFSVLPPEVNSARMYAGAGSGPLLAAAAGWDGLAGELGSAAASFGSVTSGLAHGSWQGPASAAMAAAAAPYVGFLNATAAQAMGAATQARAAAAAFESALAATIHPVMVATNRDQLMQLAAANLFGQNAPAIAATEGQYEEMWAQDVAAMVAYHSGASAAAADLAPWEQSLFNLSGKLAAALGFSPVTRPIASDPDFMQQTTNFGFFTQTSTADPGDDYFVAIEFSSPLLTVTTTSGFESTLGWGAPGQTIVSFRSPVAPSLNSTIALPGTDPFARLFTALLPLGL